MKRTITLNLAVTALLVALTVCSVPGLVWGAGEASQPPASGSPLALAREDYRVQSEKLRDAHAKIEELERRNKDQQKLVEDLNAKLNRQKNAEAAKTPPASPKEEVKQPTKKVAQQPPRPIRPEEATAKLLDFSYMREASAEDVRSLLAAGADVKARNGGMSSGWTPLMTAANNRNPEVMRLLLNEGADVNAANRWGETALLYAARNPNPCVAKVLLDVGADVNVHENIGGDTALIRAVKDGYLETVRVLLAGGANANAADNWSVTPLIAAKVWCKPAHKDEMLWMLRNAGAWE